MNRFIKESYLFLILFILIIVKEPIYRLFTIKDNIYNTTRCEFLESDYNKLLEFSEVNVAYESDYINSAVIYKDIYNYMNEITIRGGKDYKLDNNPVIYDNTLVGVIDKVDSNTSIVKLITNNSSKISVKINDEIGILEYIKDKLIVSNISNFGNINVGDIVYTSGLGNIHENIYIGEVKNIELDNKNIEQIITVNYKLNIKDIDYVTILKESI
ncbi:MAG: rod shape-determining protein MreC [Bacilli bacterium]|nr:rod shape-determining protein MreC [Bacilli bacterium]